MNEERNLATMDASGFVLLAEAVPDLLLEMRYYSTYNFVGERIEGYEEPCALLTWEAAQALRTASEEFKAQGYRLKVFDAYRPGCAVRHFFRWGLDEADQRMKPCFYPDLDKKEVFSQHYLARRSSHSRGSAVDLTLLNMATGQELDMGGSFDLLSERSHPDYPGVTPRQHENRMLLREGMLRNGFLPSVREWWHFYLAEEPFPDTYFEFPVSAAWVKGERSARSETPV